MRSIIFDNNEAGKSGSQKLAELLNCKYADWSSINHNGKLDANEMSKIYISTSCRKRMWIIRSVSNVLVIFVHINSLLKYITKMK